MTFGERLKELRIEKGLTQAELSKLLFVSFQTISKWENDINQPDLASLKLISKTLGCSIDYLLNLDEEKNKNHSINTEDLKKEILSEVKEELLEIEKKKEIEHNENDQKTNIEDIKNDTHHNTSNDNSSATQNKVVSNATILNDNIVVLSGVRCKVCSRELKPTDNKHQVVKETPDGEKIQVILCDNCFSKVQERRKQIEAEKNKQELTRNLVGKSYTVHPIDEMKKDRNPFAQEDELIQQNAVQNKQGQISKKNKKKIKFNTKHSKVLKWALVAGISVLIISIIVNIFIETHLLPNILLSLLIGYSVTSSVYCLFTDSYITEVFFEVASWSINFPGLIFSWSFEGILWLIGMKILFAVLGFLIGVCAIVLALALSIFLSVFSFVPILVSNIKKS